MKSQSLGVLLCGSLLAAAAWVGGWEARDERPAAGWREVAPGVLRSPGLPAGYALVDGDRALLIDAPADPAGLKRTIAGVLLTHHHRDTAAWAGRLRVDGVSVRAPKLSAPWLTPDGVRTYWQTALPLRNSRTAYLVLPEGLDGLDCTLTDGQAIDWRGWTVRVVAAPGHSPDHTAFAVRKGDGPLLLFCGDALAGPGTMPTPYTTDWDHWTDAGLKPAHASLRKLAALEPAVLLPAHGPVIQREPVAALEKTAKAIAEVAFLKSYERFTKQRLGNAPRYPFLAPEQAGSNGSKPWSHVFPHLWLTGNTYVLTSHSGDFLVMDPWDPHTARQVPKLMADQHLGRLEVVLCSHAHFDHYDGAYGLLEHYKPEVWTLEQVAGPIADPFHLRAPFLDARPLKVDRRVRDGETVSWREYRLRFHFLPGQTEFTTGVETTIDGKRCLFTADNFFHQDLYSGTGGWMGLNRSWPGQYADSAQKVLDLRPEWVLAEHGGAFAFDVEDFRRRVRWGREGAKAADALSPSGRHRHDWNPHRVHVEPILQKARPGDTLKAVLVADNHLAAKGRLTVTLEGRGLTPDQTWEVEVGPGDTARRTVRLQLGDRVPPGRHVLVLRVREGDRVDVSDAFLAVDVGR